MGDYDIVIDGISLKAKVADSILVLDELIPSYFNGQDILGIDLKSFIEDVKTPSSGINSKKVRMLVISSATRCCDKILQSYGIPEILKKFLINPDICFVRPSDDQISPPGVACCELACRVLKKSAGLEGSALQVVASEVGIPYQDVYASSSQVDVKPFVQKYKAILVDSKYGNILTQEQVKMVVYDAFTCYRIDSKLLSSLK